MSKAPKRNIRTPTTFFTYVCPECGDWHRKIVGTKAQDGTVRIRCSACGNLERIPGLDDE